jgi:hypothetical protein
MAAIDVDEQIRVVVGSCLAADLVRRDGPARA